VGSLSAIKGGLAGVCVGTGVCAGTGVGSGGGVWFPGEEGVAGVASAVWSRATAGDAAGDGADGGAICDSNRLPASALTFAPVSTDGLTGVGTEVRGPAAFVATETGGTAIEPRGFLPMAYPIAATMRTREKPIATTPSLSRVDSFRRR